MRKKIISAVIIGSLCLNTMVWGSAPTEQVKGKVDNKILSETKENFVETESEAAQNFLLLTYCLGKNQNEISEYVDFSQAEKSSDNKGEIFTFKECDISYLTGNKSVGTELWHFDNNEKISYIDISFDYASDSTSFNTADVLESLFGEYTENTNSDVGICHYYWDKLPGIDITETYNFVGQDKSKDDGIISLNVVLAYKDSPQNTDEEAIEKNKEETNEVSEKNSENSEKEAAYITANIIATTGHDYEYAAKEFHKIEGYKDATELANKYEQISKTRFYDGKFYWEPQEFAYFLEDLMADTLKMKITSSVSKNEDGSYSIYLLTEEDDLVLVTLFDVNEKEEYFENMIFTGSSNAAIVASAVISFLTGVDDFDTGVGTVQELITNLLDGKEGNITENGMTFSLAMVDKTAVVGIRGENYENRENTNISITEYTDQNTIKKVQQALNDKGYDCGTADGIAGQKTKNAINAYESASGITVNGIITDELLQSLGLK